VEELGGLHCLDIVVSLIARTPTEGDKLLMGGRTLVDWHSTKRLLRTDRPFFIYQDQAAAGSYCYAHTIRDAPEQRRHCDQWH
jgi:hypothetical protein